MPGEGQLLDRGEDPDPVVRAGVGGRQHEGGLGQVHPVRELLHLLGAQALTVEHDGQRVPAIGLGGEDVDQGERARHGPQPAIARPARRNGFRRG
jgi:hypothetical protein